MAAHIGNPQYTFSPNMEFGNIVPSDNSMEMNLETANYDQNPFRPGFDNAILFDGDFNGGLPFDFDENEPTFTEPAPFLQSPWTAQSPPAQPFDSNMHSLALPPPPQMMAPAPAPGFDSPNSNYLAPTAPLPPARAAPSDTFISPFHPGQPCHPFNYQPNQAPPVPQNGAFQFQQGDNQYDQSTFPAPSSLPSSQSSPPRDPTQQLTPNPPTNGRLGRTTQRRRKTKVDGKTIDMGDPVAAKRYANTEAARRSRQRRDEKEQADARRIMELTARCNELTLSRDRLIAECAEFRRRLGEEVTPTNVTTTTAPTTTTPEQQREVIVIPDDNGANNNNTSDISPVTAAPLDVEMTDSAPQQSPKRPESHLKGAMLGRYRTPANEYLAAHTTAPPPPAAMSTAEEPIIVSDDVEMTGQQQQPQQQQQQDDDGDAAVAAALLTYLETDQAAAAAAAPSAQEGQEGQEGQVVAEDELWTEFFGEEEPLVTTSDIDFL